MTLRIHRNIVPFRQGPGEAYKAPKAHSINQNKARGCVLLSLPSGMTPRRTGKAARACLAGVSVEKKRKGKKLFFTGRSLSSGDTLHVVAIYRWCAAPVHRRSQPPPWFKCNMHHRSYASWTLSGDVSARLLAPPLIPTEWTKGRILSVSRELFLRCRSTQYLS